MPTTHKAKVTGVHQQDVWLVQYWSPESRRWLPTSLTSRGVFINAYLDRAQAYIAQGYSQDRLPNVKFRVRRYVPI